MIKVVWAKNESRKRDAKRRRLLLVIGQKKLRGTATHYIHMTREEAFALSLAIRKKLAAKDRRGLL